MAFKRTFWLPIVASGAILLSTACTQRKPDSSATTPQVSQPKVSAIAVDVKKSGPIVITTSAARFEVVPSGYIRAALLKDGQEQTLEDEGQTSGDSVVQNGKPVKFALDFSNAKVGEATGKLGIGKQILSWRKIQIYAHLPGQPSHL